MHYKNGMYVGGEPTDPTFKSWKQMMRRCQGQSDKSKHYRERGITVCERWQKYENFLADMGPRADGMTLDRIDVNSNYQPENCQWLSHTAQMRNRTNTVRLTLGDKTQCLAEWARELGLSHETIRKRIRNGWPMDRVLSADRYKRFSKEPA